MISQKTKNKKTSHWDFFEHHLAGREELPHVEREPAADSDAVEVSGQDVHAAQQEIIRRWGQATQATYAAGAAKELSVTGAVARREQATGEHGTEWGTAIHMLLEAAMRSSEANLADLAYTVVSELGLDPAVVPQALQTVDSVTQSCIWRRAREAGQRLAEVPFTHCIRASKAAASVPTVLPA